MFKESFHKNTFKSHDQHGCIQTVSLTETCNHTNQIDHMVRLQQKPILSHRQ